MISRYQNANFVEHPVAGWSRGIGITNAGITSDGWSGKSGVVRRRNGMVSTLQAPLDES